MTLLELYQCEQPRFKTAFDRIMLSRSRMKYKRLEMRQWLRANSTQGVDFPMSELRELQYFLHPNDARRKRKAA